MVRVWLVGGALLTITVVSGCADRGDQWENPSVSQSNWEVHSAECRRLAAQRAEDDYAIAETGFAERFGRSTTLRTDVARYDAERHRDDLFERCMKDRGYRRTPSRPAPASEPGAPR